MVTEKHYPIFNDNVLVIMFTGTVDALYLYGPVITVYSRWPDPHSMHTTHPSGIYVSTHLEEIK